MKALFIVAAILVSLTCLVVLVPVAGNGLAEWRAGCSAEARQMSIMAPQQDPNARWWCEAK